MPSPFKRLFHNDWFLFSDKDWSHPVILLQLMLMSPVPGIIALQSEWQCLICGKNVAPLRTAKHAFAKFFICDCHDLNATTNEIRISSQVQILFSHPKWHRVKAFSPIIYTVASCLTFINEVSQSPITALWILALLAGILETNKFFCHLFLVTALSYS